MTDLAFEMEIPSGIKMEAFEAVVRKSWPTDKPADFTINPLGSSIGDPATIAVVTFSSMVARDVWIRYVRPRLDKKYGVNVIKEHSPKRQPKSGSSTHPVPDDSASK